MSDGKTEIVVDTNVPIVANGGNEQADPSCRLNCIASLRDIQDERIVLLDDKNLILGEYKRRLSFSGQPEPGDAFFKWLFDNQANPAHCRKVPLTVHQVRGFEEFPDDPSLDSFDHDDRKFVAVVRASGTGPAVLNASDRDWWFYRQVLQKHGVKVEFLCPNLMKAR